MRITDKENNLPTTKEEQKTEKHQNSEKNFEEDIDVRDQGFRKNQSDDDFSQDNQRQKNKRSSNFIGFKLLKSCGCLILMLLIVIIAILWLVLSFFQPIVKEIDALPNDFPSIINVYKPEIADIKIQEQDDKIKAIKIINALPEWLVAPIWSKLSPNLKTRILAESDSKSPTIEGLKTVISDELASGQVKTVFASWDNLTKDKKEIFEYYKNQLLSANFKITENMGDYDWNLIFSKNNVSGAISIYDNLMSGGSAIDMVVSY
mgnify:CR=1 FL=1